MIRTDRVARTACLSRPCVAAAILLAAAVAAPRCRAQTSTLYLTDLLHPTINASEIAGIRGGALQFRFTSIDYEEYAIAVWGDVRTAGLRASSDPFPSSGHRYDLLGNSLNSTYPPAPFALSVDGTTDGQFNYCVAAGGVHQFDRNWQNGISLFNSPTNRGFTAGITYDPFDQTLWILTYESDPIVGLLQWVEQFDLNGTRLGGSRITLNSVPTNLNGTGLALDPADRTLWVVNQNDLIQVDRTGNVLAPPISVWGLGLIAASPTGAEFNLLPEPSGLILMGVMAFLLARAAPDRRKRGKKIPC